MSFEVNSKEGLVAMNRAISALEKTDEELAKVEIAMSKYQSSLQNEITEEAKSIFEKLHKSIDDTKQILHDVVEHNVQFFTDYQKIVKGGLGQ